MSTSTLAASVNESSGTTTTNAGLVVGIIAAIVFAVVVVAGFCWCHQRYKSKNRGHRSECFPGGWLRRVFGKGDTDPHHDPELATGHAPTTEEGKYRHVLQRHQPDVEPIAESNPYQYDNIIFSNTNETETAPHTQLNHYNTSDPLYTSTTNPKLVHKTCLSTGEEEAFKVPEVGAIPSDAHQRTTSMISNVHHQHHHRVASTVSYTGGPTLTSSTAINHQRLISGISTAGPTSVSHSRSTSNIPQPHLVTISAQQLLQSNNSSLSHFNHQRQLSLSAMPLAATNNSGRTLPSQGVHHERLYSHLSISSSAQNLIASNANPRPPTSYDVSEAPLGNYVP